MNKRIAILAGCLLLGIMSGAFAQTAGTYFDPSTGGVPLNFQGKPISENPIVTGSDYVPDGVASQPQKPAPSLGDHPKSSTIFDTTTGSPTFPSKEK